MNITDYDLLYDLPTGEYQGAGIDGIRTVTIRAGRSLEIMCHPITRLSREARREAKRRRTTPAMEKINARNTTRHMLRLIEANFTAQAVVMTCTYAYPTEDFGLLNLNELRDYYETHKLPEEEWESKRHLKNFFARLRRIVKASGGKPGDLKWIQSTEEGSKPPVWGLPPKYHHHLVIEGPGLTRDVCEAAWKHGFAQCARLDTSADRPAALAAYLTKQRRGRTWSHSRNLKDPQPRVSDRKMSRRRMNKIAADVRHNGRAIFEALYPGYKLVELPDPRYSDYVQGCYIYARMRRRD